MRAIQLSIDDDLLRRIDAQPDVKRNGRSAFLRQAAEEALRRRRARDIRDAYRRGYGGAPCADDEFDVAPEARAWPDE